MKKIYFIFSIAIIGVMFMSCASMRDYFIRNWREKDDKNHSRILSTRTFPENIAAVFDIPYINSGDRGHLLDVYYPNNMEGPFPVIINIHGGGFLFENKENNRLYCYHIAKNGFIVFNINYRLVSKEAKFPTQIEDVINALDWIGNNMELYPADTEKIYIVGHSAGGYLAAMASLISESQRLQNVFNVNKPNIKINAIAVNCGLLELERRGIQWWGMRRTIFERGYKKEEYYQNLFLKNLPEISLLPPAFLTSNTDDALDFMTNYFVNILEENKLDYNFYFIERGNRKLRHCFDLFSPDREESISLRNAMLKYLLQY